MSEPTKSTPFCTGQGLSLLKVRTDVKPYLSGERFFLDRHPELDKDRKEESAWEENIDRAALVQDLTAEGKIKRLAVVCAAGLGKSTNLQWLQYRLAEAPMRQVPFLFRLDKSKKLPANLRQLYTQILPKSASRGEKKQVRGALDRYCRQGRITLLLDGLDQASEEGWDILLELLEALKASEWSACPLVVSARPHALFERWEEIVGDKESLWRFVRVEPLAEKERKLLLNWGGDRDHYSRLPAGGRELMANPRNIEYVRELINRPSRPRYAGKYSEPKNLRYYTLRDLRTASHVFAGAADHLVRLGMTAPKARRLANPKAGSHPEPLEDDDFPFAHDLLGALGWTMYCFRLFREQSGPNVSHIPPERMATFYNRVRARLVAAGLRPETYDIRDLRKDIVALAALNSKIQYDLLDAVKRRRESFRWYNRSLQEFYAAWWLARFADDKDIERLRKMRYADRDKAAATLYSPLWGFLVEMPRAVLQMEPHAKQRQKAWLRAVSVLFEPKSPGCCEMNYRCCEMIYRCWPALRRTEPGRKVIADWRQEFRDMVNTNGRDGDVARSVVNGFRPCPPNPAAGHVTFTMGSPDGEKHREDEYQHEVMLTPFAMHQYPVTNAQFELFDPNHSNEGWYGKPAPPAEEALDHPVVNVRWYEAWCFGKWTGYRLPTEAEWEYACRGGSPVYQTFHVGDSLSSVDANFDGNHPYGEGSKGPYLERTTRVGFYSHAKNGFKLYDMHGNVWEWCQDWYDAGFYRTQKGRQPDPVNRKVAASRALRGGCWDNNGWDCRSAGRIWPGPGYRYRYIGFRLAAVPASLEPGQEGRAERP